MVEYLERWLRQVSPIPRLRENGILIVGVDNVDADEGVAVQRRLALILQ